MLDTLVITDLTQMRDGDRVCIAGISKTGQCIRPVSENREKGIPDRLLWNNSKVIIRPGAKIEFDLHQIKPEPPHIEDRGFDPNHIINKGICNNTEFENILRISSFNTVSKIFNNLLKWKKWVKPGENTRSIGTISKFRIENVQFSENSAKPRISFSDDSGQIFDCPVSDRALRNYCFSSVIKRKRERTDLARELVNSWKNASSIYLRLGLARPFKVSEDSEPRCYVQITGVHSFPDYLQGKTFADF